MPCCSCLPESFSNPPLSRTRLSPAASSKLILPGSWSATGRRERALGRHLEAPSGSCSKREKARWNKNVSKFCYNHTVFIYSFLCTFFKRRKNARKPHSVPYEYSMSFMRQSKVKTLISFMYK